MHQILSYSLKAIFIGVLLILISCEFSENLNSKISEKGKTEIIEVIVDAENFINANKPIEINTLDSGTVYVKTLSDGWFSLDVNIPIAGRYKSQIQLASQSNEAIKCWIEDYHDNKDDRTYNITGDIIVVNPSDNFSIYSKDGSPLNSGLHKMKIHFDKAVNIDWVKFTLIKEHDITPKTLTQRTDGDKWKVAWADEFDASPIDTTKWTYDIGDWGWGNNELQYYTNARSENARIENGNLIIEARKNNKDNTWTSARLTTRGKVSFLYGKIEFRAKVPAEKGNWAAGWTLGDEYVDELSWPYCGEIDIMESVGYEMDDITGNGIAHASAHCGAYYFKLGNQPTGTIEVANMSNEFHTYAIEWTPDGIKSYVDDSLYVTYNDTSTDLSWPFSKPQNLILNLSMGGGWGGANGMNDSVNSQKMIIDYVRVYELL